MSHFNFSEKIALTVENGIPTLWRSLESGETTRVFKNSKGKAILSPDFQWWEREKKDAPNCEYAEIWLGDFPYGSWAWTIRRCKKTGSVVIGEISTDINPRGDTQQDKFRESCKTYVPS